MKHTVLISLATTLPLALSALPATAMEFLCEQPTYSQLPASYRHLKKQLDALDNALQERWWHELRTLEDFEAFNLLINDLLVANCIEDGLYLDIDKELATFFEHFAEVRGDAGKLTGDDRALLKCLEERGLKIAVDEGECFLEPDVAWLFARTKWSEGARPIVDILKQEPPIMVTRNGLLCLTHRDLAAVIQLWEKLLRSKTLSELYVCYARSRFIYLLEHMLWSPSCFSGEGSDVLYEEMRELYLPGCAEAFPGSLMADSINRYLNLMKASNWSFNESIRQQMRLHINRSLDAILGASKPEVVGGEQDSPLDVVTGYVRTREREKIFWRACNEADDNRMADASAMAYYSVRSVKDGRELRRVLAQATPLDPQEIYYFARKGLGELISKTPRESEKGINLAEDYQPPIRGVWQAATYLPETPQEQAVLMLPSLGGKDPETGTFLDLEVFTISMPQHFTVELSAVPTSNLGDYRINVLPSYPLNFEAPEKVYGAINWYITSIEGKDVSRDLKLTRLQAKKSKSGDLVYTPSAALVKKFPQINSFVMSTNTSDSIFSHSVDDEKPRKVYGLILHVSGAKVPMELRCVPYFRPIYKNYGHNEAWSDDKREGWIITTLDKKQPSSNTAASF